TVLLIDEDTSATNFMIRDVRMRELVSEEKEPITPFIDKIVALRDKFDISAVLVMGGSGDYFSVADTVIMMDEYKPKVVTEKVREINRKYPAPTETFSRDFGIVTHRQFHPSSLQTKKGKRHKTQGKELYTIIMGKTEIVFDALEQLVDLSQTRMIAEIIQYLERTNSLEGKTLTELLAEIERKMDKDGLGFAVLNGDKHPGDLARPRKHEIAGVLNRMRTLKVIRQN
ncbi:MAG TPA: P-loop domain-containing protein, partial [Bacillota bacterium]|nr:P-loop domain-containing protein [Bacillota bacterium]